MKRLAVVCAFFMLLSFCVSCAAEEIVEIPEFESEVSTADLAGYNFNIVQLSSTSGLVNHIEDGNPFGYVATTTFADAVLKRFSDVEQEYNCKINLETETSSRDNIVLAMLAGTYFGESIFSSDIQVMDSFAGSGVFLPISGLSAINLSDADKWGDFSIMEMNAYKGEIYGVTPMYWPLRQPHAINVIVSNLSLVNKYNLFDPRENVENGTWNWDAFEQLVSTYYIVDAEKIYTAMACRYFDFVKLCVFGNGVNILYTNENGETVSDIYSQKASDAFAWAKYIWTNYKSNFQYSDASPEWTWIADNLINEDCVTALSPTWMVYDTFAQEIEQFAIYPFPIGPNGTMGQWPSVLEGTEFFSVPFSSKEPDISAFLIDKICEPLNGFENEEAISEYIARNVLFDERDTDILLNLYKTGRFSYWPSGADGFWRPFGYAMDNKTPSEFFESNISIFEEIIEEYMIPNQAIADYLK